MANPRQRRKARSSTHSGKSQRAKRSLAKKLAKSPDVQGPSILKEKWDAKATVRQNYARLGLLSSTAMVQSGGVEDLSVYQFGRTSPNVENQQASSSSLPNKARTGRIVRDEEGNIAALIETSDAPIDTPWGLPLNDDARERTEPQPKVSTFDHKDPSADVSGNSPLVRETIASLEALQAEAAPVLRHVSAVQAGWLSELVRRHDDDFQAMSQDIDHNKLQQSAGQIKRAVKKAGGIDAIRNALSVK